MNCYMGASDNKEERVWDFMLPSQFLSSGKKHTVYDV